MRTSCVGALGLLVLVYPGVAVGSPLDWFPLVPVRAVEAPTPTGTITAEFPDWAPADRPFSDPVGATIVITGLSDNRISSNPEDGVISVYEARIYARDDTGPNTLYFDPGFGRITIAYDYFTLPSPEDTFLGHNKVRAPGALWDLAGSMSGVFLDGMLQVTGNKANVHDCYVGLDWDKVTPLTHVFYPSIAVSGKQSRVHDNVFCADPEDGGGGSLSIGGEGNWAYSNAIGVLKDWITTQPAIPEVAMYVSGKNNRIGDKANCSNHLCASGTGIVVTGQGHTIRANYIGPNSAGRTSLYGVEFRPPSNAGDPPTTGNYLGGPIVIGSFGANSITHFTEAGVYFHTGCDDNAMGGNDVGIYQTGKIWGARGKTGVIIGANTTGNEIGGSAPAYRNWIAGQKQQAVLVEPGATEVQIQGCHIGFDANLAGVTKGHGIRVVGAKKVLIGGARESAGSNNGNTISGCGEQAICLQGCTGPIRIEGNIIGLSPDKTTRIGNGRSGIYIADSQNVIVGTPKAASASAASGGDTAAVAPPDRQKGNLLASCERGIGLLRSKSVHIDGNLIGWSGSEAWGNTSDGILVRNSSKVRIGQEHGGNLIQANQNGVWCDKGANDVWVQYSQVLKNRGAGVVFSGPVQDCTVFASRVGWNQSHGVIIDGSAGPAYACSAFGDWNPYSLIPDDYFPGPVEIIGNWGCGVVVSGEGAQRTQVFGAHIGAVWSPIPGNLYRWKAYPNGKDGVRVQDGAKETFIGRELETQRCWIMANQGPGVRLTNDAHHNRVCGAYIGREFRQNGVEGNEYGVVIERGAHDNTIGVDPDVGLTVPWSTHIASNARDGIAIAGVGSDRNVVEGCYIGIGKHWDGLAEHLCPDGNGDSGVYIENGAYNIIGAPSATEYANVISGNGNGMWIRGRGNQVIRCRIGVDPTGAFGSDVATGRSYANDGGGIEVHAGVQTVIGGPNDGYGNQIANNGGDGILVYLGRNTYVVGNLIGTSADGRIALPNAGCGVSVEDSWGVNYIGSGQPRKANVISGNRDQGVRVEPWDPRQTEACPTQVVGNFIGTDPLGAKAVPNGKQGIVTRCPQTQIKANVVSGNRGDGLAILGGAHECEVRNNTIGFTDSGNGLLANGGGTAIVVGPKAGSTYIPERTWIEGNRLYSPGCGIWFQGAAALDDPPPSGNRAIGNAINLRRNGSSARGKTGVLVSGCQVYLEKNEVYKESVGVQISGKQAYAVLRACELELNGTCVKLTEGAKALLGDYSASAQWRQGRNRFIYPDAYALDAYGMAASGTLLAENNYWQQDTVVGVQSLIRFPKGDTARERVDFDPLINGEHPTGQDRPATCGAVASASAQPTAQGAAITFALTSAAAVTVEVTNVAGRPVRALVSDRPCAAGLNTVLWDGRSDAGIRVPTGRYLIRIIARSPSGGQSQSLTPLTLAR